MARKKSLSDIERQISRIRAEAARRALSGVNASQNKKRMDKASEIGERYSNNIKTMRSYGNNFTKYDDAEDSKKAQKYADRMDNRKYSQRTYMGLSNG